MTLWACVIVVSALCLSSSAGEGITGGSRDTTSENTTLCYVDAGVLVTFPGNTSTQWQQDVLDSLLFAQLAARVNHSRGSDPEDWFSRFQYVLNTIGWVMTSTKFNVGVSDDYFALSSLALNEMAQTMHWDTKVETFRRLFNTLQSLPDNDINIKLLYGTTSSENSSTINATNLIISSFQVSSRNEVQLNLLMLGFQGSQDIVQRYLFYVYRTADVKFTSAKSSAMVLNQALFRKVKPTILKMLGDKAKTMISKVEVKKV